jgi:hypothetical protein
MFGAARRLLRLRRSWRAARESRNYCLRTPSNRANAGISSILSKCSVFIGNLPQYSRNGRELGVKVAIHGDHGSLINLHEPNLASRSHVLVSDYAVAFSTLLALEASGVKSGYDLRLIAIHDLLPQLATLSRPMAQQASARLSSSAGQVPFVYLEEDGSLRMLKQPLPRLGDPGPVVN